MIKSNVELGAIIVPTVIELGNGDVKVAQLTYEDDKKVGISFINDVPSKIGTKHNDGCCTTDETKPQAIISFTDIASIEVVEDKLRIAKIKLRNL